MYNNKIYIGVDNGSSGSLGIIGKGICLFYKTPVKVEQSYTKKKQNITRIDFEALKDLISGFNSDENQIRSVKVIIERPYVNPLGFKATASALRALESTLIAVEALGYPYIYVDSKEWQKELLPKGVKGTPELKKASLDIGCRLFPLEKERIKDHKDSDGLLIAEWARRKNL